MNKKIIGFVTVMVLSMPSFAQEEVIIDNIDLTEVPTEVEQVVNEQAKQMGYDLRTPEGERKFDERMNKERAEQARKLGFDLNTPQGRQDFAKFMDQRIEKIAGEKGVDFRKPEGRREVVRDLMRRGEFAAVPMDRQGYERNGWKFEPQPIDLKSLPTEVQPLMAEKAAEFGVDLTTQKGKQEFANKLYDQKRTEAKKMGINLDSPNGRRAYQERVQKEFREVAKNEKANLNTKSGREKVLNHMAKTGQFGMIPAQPQNFQRLGFQPPRTRGNQDVRNSRRPIANQKENAKGNRHSFQNNSKNNHGRVPASANMNHHGQEGARNAPSSGQNHGGGGRSHTPRQARPGSH